jgi:hypothetical protein
MFIALQQQYGALQRSAMCFGVQLHAAPNGAEYIRNPGYKHVAPPEQEPSIPMTIFRAKPTKPEPL